MYIYILYGPGRNFNSRGDLKSCPPRSSCDFATRPCWPATQTLPMHNQSCHLRQATDSLNEPLTPCTVKMMG